MPVVVLLPLERGLTLAEVGLAFSVQGFVVLALELPTGGLADAVGRRPVLVAATATGIASLGLFLVADSVALLMAVFVLQGIYRALDSGPLEAWFVDTTLDRDPDARLDVGLSAQGTVIGLAIAGGALLGGLLVAVDPLPGVPALAVPMLGALVLMVLKLVGLLVLMPEPRPAAGLGAATASARNVPRMIREGVAVARRSRVLTAVLAVELFWGFGMATFEALFPARLADVLDGEAAAAAVTGPAASAAWVASAVGAAVVPWLGRRLGIAPIAVAMRLLQAATVVAMGLLAGLAGIVAAYLACFAVHGASNAAHRTLLHREVEGPVRATVVSLNSMVAQPAGSIGIIVLTALATGTSVGTAMVAGGVVLALAAPLYLPAWRHERERRVVAEPQVCSAAVATAGSRPGRED